MAAPNADSAAAAVETLRAELDMVDAALDAIDRKAALIPPVVAAIAGIFIAPDTTFSDIQIWLLIPAVLTGITAIILALIVLQTRYLSLGPNAEATADSVHHPVAVLNAGIARSLAGAVGVLSELSIRKGRMLNWAMRLAGATILLVALTRGAGGLTLTDDQEQPQPPASQQPADQSPSSSGQGTQDEGTAINLGQQVAAKSHLPSDLQVRTRHIEKSDRDK